MTPYIIQSGALSREDYRLFLCMRYIFEELPNFSPIVSCHVICRAFATQFPVRCADGHFGKGNCHSWLVLRDIGTRRDGRQDQVIADMYPVAGATPFLILKTWQTHWFQAYNERPQMTAHIIATPGLAEQVALVSEAIKRLQAHNAPAH